MPMIVMTVSNSISVNARAAVPGAEPAIEIGRRTFILSPAQNIVPVRHDGGLVVRRDAGEIAVRPGRPHHDVGIAFEMVAGAVAVGAVGEAVEAGWAVVLGNGPE